MHPRPLHRWKSFWLGVFVVVFIGWAWARSNSHWDILALCWNTHGDVLGFDHSGSMAALSWGRDSGGRPMGFRLGHYAQNGPEKWFPSPVSGTHNANGFGYMGIAHWFLILLFLLPWTTWLVWRSRRMKLLAPGTAGPQTGPSGP